MRTGGLYRLPDEGLVAGVCAGLGHRFEWSKWAVRGVWLVSLLLFTKISALAYIVASLVLKQRHLSEFSNRANDSAISSMQREFEQLRERINR